MNGIFLFSINKKMVSTNLSKLQIFFTYLLALSLFWGHKGEPSTRRSGLLNFYLLLIAAFTIFSRSATGWTCPLSSNLQIMNLQTMKLSNISLNLITNGFQKRRSWILKLESNSKTFFTVSIILNVKKNPGLFLMVSGICKFFDNF